MKQIIIIVLIISSLNLNAQVKESVKFDNVLNWSQIKDKAKKEDKFIFVDCYTTWCVPCRTMSTQIFPQKAVSEFLNANFINVEMQFDKTLRDDTHIKRFYKVAMEFRKKYHINSYPTYLFFNSDGVLVHIILGASNSGKEFIIKASSSLKLNTQYIFLKKRFIKGERDSTFLKTLVKIAQQSNDRQFTPIAINAYLSTQNTLLTPANLRLIAAGTSKSSDKGFPILKNYSAAIDSINGKGTTEAILRTIAFDEIILPGLRKNGKKTNYGGGMVVFSGEVRKSVDWSDIRNHLNLNYPEYSQDMLLAAKCTWYEWLEDWGNYCTSVNDYKSKVGSKIDLRTLNEYAWTIFLNSDNPEHIHQAIEWSTFTLSNGNERNPDYINTYASLLYKSGDKNQAISVLEKFMKSSDGKNEYIKKELSDMREGKKTW